jgi:hypothetical protein
MIIGTIIAVFHTFMNVLVREAKRRIVEGEKMNESQMF